MKKSTLFFKVMVLLALLVPWAAWGQDRDRLAPKDPPKYESWYIRGYKSITLTSEGKIPNDNTQKYKNINLSDVNPAWRRSLWGWSFDSERGSAIISPSNSGVTASVTGSDKSIHISGTPTVDAIYVRVESEHQKGWIKITFNAKKPEDVSKSLDISYTNGEGQKIYDGKEISDDDVRKGLTVKAGDVTFNEKEDYTVEVVNNSANVGKYAVKVTITKKGYEGSGKKENAYEITPKELTVTIKDQEITLPTESLDTELTSTGADATIGIEGIVNNENVTLSGAIKVKTEGNDKKPGKYTDELISNDIVLAKENDVNKNYTLSSTIEAGDLTVKYNITDDNYDDAFTVKIDGNGTYTYDNKEHGASITSKIEGLKDCLEVWYKEAKEEATKETPKHVGEYTVIIKKKADAKCEYVTIPEAGIATDKKITITAIQLTITGSLEVEQGAELDPSYDADKLNLEAETSIEGLTLTFTGSAKPNEKAKTDEVKTIEDAFDAWEGDGSTIQITENEDYFLEGDITIKEVKISLVVTAKPIDWTDVNNTHADVTVYVNEEGVITNATKGSVSDGTLSISLSDNFDLSEWKFTVVNYLAVMSGDNDIQEGGEYYTWSTIYAPNGGDPNGLKVSKKESSAVVSGLPKEVKVKMEKADGSVGYISFTFKSEDASEEPGDDTAWTEGEDAQATVAIFINEEGNVVSADKGSLKEGTLAVTLADLELADGWTLSAQDRSIVLYGDAVVTEGLSWETVFDASTPDPTGAITEFRVSKGETSVYSELPKQVKIKVEQDENVGYVLVVLKPVVTISEDDINKGGDDDNTDGKIDDDKITFIGSTTGAKNVIYDGLPHGLGMLEITVDGKTLTLSEDKDEYSVTYEGLEGEPVDAGTYSATITFNEAMGYSGTVTLTNSVVIAQRPITLYFSFEDGILEGEEFVLGENVFIDVKEGSFAEGEKAEFDELIEKGIISAEFALGETQSDGTVEVQLVSFNYPAGEVTGYDLKYSNYDAKLLTGHVKEHGEGGTETELPDAGEAGGDGTIDYPGEGDSGVIVGDVDIIDEETGIGGSGINYRQYELKFCETDFFPNLNDYEVEGLKLFSRHNKFYTKANGSFTIWYEKDGVKNGEYGDYRIYISRNGADGDYSELKLDEVSDYFQIRNVNSDIWVRIYYGTGLPVANEEITATDARAYTQANKIVVITPEPTDVQIISMAGAVVATDQVTGQREFANLAEGVYIVRMGETVIKLQVRN